MIHLKHRIIILLIIPVLFLNLSVAVLSSVAHALGESGHSATHKVSTESNDHCPACPTEVPQNTDHSHSSCEHHSSLYFGSQPLLILYNPTVTTHITHDPFNALPEVYLDKFIPPETRLIC